MPRSSFSRLQARLAPAFGCFHSGRLPNTTACQQTPPNVSYTIQLSLTKPQDADPQSSCSPHGEFEKKHFEELSSESATMSQYRGTPFTEIFSSAYTAWWTSGYLTNRIHFLLGESRHRTNKNYTSNSSTTGYYGSKPTRRNLTTKPGHLELRRTSRRGCTLTTTDPQKKKKNLSSWWPAPVK